MASASHLVVAALVNLVVAVLIRRDPEARTDPFQRGLFWFCVLIAVAALATALRADAGPLNMRMLAAPAALLAWGMLGYAVRSLVGRSGPARYLVAPLFAWLVLVTIVALSDVAVDLLAAYFVMVFLVQAMALWHTVAACRQRDVNGLQELAILLGGACALQLYCLATMGTDLLQPEAELIARSFIAGLAPLLGLVIARDLAARRQQDALADLRRMMDRLLAGLPLKVALVRILPDGTAYPFYMGGDARAVLGPDCPPHDPKPTIERPGVELPPGLPDARSFWRQALHQDQAMIEFSIREPGQAVRWLRGTTRRLSLDPDGSAEVVAFTTDITAEREARLRVLKSSRLAAVGEMAGGLAHELNQPLAVISLAADNALRAFTKQGAAADNVMPRLQRIVANAARARDIVEHLRWFAQDEAQDAPLAPVAIAEAVQGALALTGGRLREAGIEVRLDLPGDLPPVLGRLRALEQTILQLLVNAHDAIAATRQDGGVIRIAASAGEGQVRLVVADNGCGISEDAMPRLFEPFFTTKEPGKGSGLGLPIAHATVSGMGGTIVAANAEDGAVFTLGLPAAAG